MRDKNAPRFEGTGEILLQEPDRATGWWTERSVNDAQHYRKTSAEYLRADPTDMPTLLGGDKPLIAKLLALQLKQWEELNA